MTGAKKTDTYKYRVMDTSLQDTHQSLLATRMRTEELLPAAKIMDQIGFWSVEV